MGDLRRLWSAAALLLVAVVLASCGGDESTGASGGDEEERLYPWVKGPSREFLVPRGDNAVQTFGREATKAEREQASRVIAVYMRAREAEDFEKACSQYSRPYAAEMFRDANDVSGGKVKNCAQALAYFGPKALGQNYENNLTGPVDSLRIEEGRGYAQYHGNDGRDWVLSVEREDGKWWVALSAPADRMK